MKALQNLRPSLSIFPSCCTILLMVRLYVGGLAETTTSGELAERFRTFGTVSRCEVAAPKPDDTLRPPSCSCRGFGHLQLDPLDEASFRKCLHVVSDLDARTEEIIQRLLGLLQTYSVSILLQYNGSKWKGKILRVQVAEPHFTDKLEEERIADAEEFLQQTEVDEGTLGDQVEERPIILTMPNGQVITVCMQSPLHQA